jgi:hypothetical protein
VVDEHDEHRQHEDLVRDRIEERAERGCVAPPARDALVEPVGRHRNGEQQRCPVLVPSEIELVHSTTTGTDAARATVS